MPKMKMKKVARNTKNSGPVVPMPDDIAAHLERMFAGERIRFERVLRDRFPAETVSEIGLPQRAAVAPLRPLGA